MTTRRSLLVRTGALALALGLGRLPALEAEAATAAPTSTEMAFEFWTNAIVSPGGLCAPRSPIYEMQAFPMSARPIAEALPSFSAKRGV